MKKRVLVVDDDSSIRKSLKKVLEETGYEVRLADDGQEAEGKLATERIDLLLLDLELPKQDGWDVFGTVKSQSPLLPVVIITGQSDCGEVAAIVGADALLEKPIDVAALLKKIEELLAEGEEQRLHKFETSHAGRDSALVRLTLSNQASGQAPDKSHATGCSFE